MTDPWFQTLFADRIGGKKYGKDDAIYKFEKIKRAKKAALESAPERILLDFGIGENEEMAAEEVFSSLIEETGKIENRGYSDNGIPEYKEAAAVFMQREFGVKLDPITQINHCMGCKTALAMIPAIFINPGDITLMTTPGYPIAGTHTHYYGGKVHDLPLLRESNFLPDLENIPQEIKKGAKLIVINYPNSPTGALAPHSFYEKVVRFAKDNKIIVVQDATHGMLSFGQKPTSFLEIDGAEEVGIELHSMSKGFDMIGWRMGFVCGNALLVQAFSDVKDNCDSGQFIPIQKAAAAALRNPKIPQNTRKRYELRQKKLVKTLNKVGCPVEMPGGTFFLYAPSPKGARKSTSFANAEEASQHLIKNQSICTVPWDDAGSFIRFSVTYPAYSEEEENQTMQELEKRLRLGEYKW